MRKRVFVTGLGIVAPLRPFEGVDSFWSALCSGGDAIRVMKPPALDLGGEWPMAGIDMSSGPGDLGIEDKAGYMAGHALNAALNDSGLGRGSLNDERVTGIALGTVLGNILCKEKMLMESGSGPLDNGRKSVRGAFWGDSLSDPASVLSVEYNLNGPVITVSTACASGTDAVGIAARKITAGKADVMYAGGVDILSDFAIAGFDALQAITKEKVRPFDKNRSGLALGEGAAFVVLESERHAVERGASLYGEILGYASRSDANHLTGPHREGRGLCSAINRALSEAGLEPSMIDYINAHGTGTLYNDLMETKALKHAFGKIAYDIPVSSTKSMLGHSFGAAGVIEAICCLLAIRTGTIPPTINFRERDPDCDLDYVPNEARRHTVKTAMSQSAGFGGQNSVIIFALS